MARHLRRCFVQAHLHRATLLAARGRAIDTPSREPLIEVGQVITDCAADSIPGGTRGVATNVAAASIGPQECDRNPEMGSGGAFINKMHGMTPLSSI